MLRVFLIAMFFQIAAQAADYSLKVHPTAAVESVSKIKLLDIAEIEGPDAGVRIKFSNVPIHFGYADSAEITLNNNEVSQAIRVALMGNKELAGLRPFLHIPEKVTIVKKSDILSKEVVTAALLKQMQEQCGDCTFEFKELRFPAVMPTAKKNQFSIDLANKLPRGGFTLPLQIMKGEKKEIFWLAGSVVVYKSVPVLTRSVPLGERIGAQDFQFKKEDVTYSYKTVPTVEELVGAELTRPLRAGQPVWRDDIKREWAVHSGQITKVLVGDDNFEVSMMAEAAQNGYIGDIIRLKNTNTKKTISGEVIAKGTVVIK